MKIVIDIPNYDAEWINNAHHIPSEINSKIADTIISGTPLPENCKEESEVIKFALEYLHESDMSGLDEDFIKTLETIMSNYELKYVPYL